MAKPRATTALPNSGINDFFMTISSVKSSDRAHYTARTGGEILPKVVDGRDSSSGFFHSVYELNAGDHVAQQRAAVEPSPAPLGLLGEFEDHRQSRLA